LHDENSDARRKVEEEEGAPEQKEKVRVKKSVLRPLPLPIKISLERQANREDGSF
jgi:hypothetical protein